MRCGSWSASALGDWEGIEKGSHLVLKLSLPAPVACSIVLPDRPTSLASYSFSNTVVSAHYHVGKEISEGSFGGIFKGPSISPSLQTRTTATR